MDQQEKQTCARLLSAPLALFQYFCLLFKRLFSSSQQSSSENTESSELREVTGEAESIQEQRNVWARWRRVLMLALLTAIAFLGGISYSIVASFFPIEAAEKGSSVLFTTIIISSSPFILMIFSPIIGYYLPKLGLKMTLISGHALLGGGFILLGSLAYMPHGTVFIVYGVLLRMTEGLGWAMTNTTTLAFLPALFPQRVATTTGIILAGIALGYAVGPQVGTGLAIAAGYGAPFWVLGGLTYSLLPLTCLVTKEESTSSKVLPKKLVIKLLSSLNFSMIQIADVAAFASLTIVDATLSLYLHKEINLNLLYVSVNFSAMAVSYVLGTFITGPLSDKLGPRIFIINGLLVNGGGLVLLSFNASIPLPQKWTILFAMAVIGFGAAVTDTPTYSDLLKQAQKLCTNEDNESVISAVSGILAFSQTVGNVVGTLFGGLLTYFIDFPTAVLLLGEFTLAHTVLLLGVSAIDHIPKKCATTTETLRKFSDSVYSCFKFK